MLFRAHARDTVLETPFTSNRPSNVTCPYPGRQIAAQHAARQHKPLRVVACAGQASPAVRRTNQNAIDERTVSAVPQSFPRARSFETNVSYALGVCSVAHASRCLVSMLFRAHVRNTVLETPHAGNRPSNDACPYPGRQIAAQHAARHHKPLRVVACAGRPLQLCVEPIRMPLMSELYPPHHNHFQELAVWKQRNLRSRRARCGTCKPMPRLDAFQSSCARYGA